MSFTVEVTVRGEPLMNWRGSKEYWPCPLSDPDGAQIKLVHSRKSLLISFIAQGQTNITEHKENWYTLEKFCEYHFLSRANSIGLAL